MWTVLVSLAAVLCFLLVNPAQAERRIFIIANDAGAYGVDRCLATGAKCGATAANAYCKSQEFTGAASFRRVARDDITRGIPVGGTGGCKGSKCDDFVAIVCAR